MATLGVSGSQPLNLNRTSVPISIPGSSMNAGTSTPERPRSALTRGVKITEFHPSREVNPEPVMPEEAEYLLEEYLSPRKLKLLTGMEDLSEVKFLEMKVDTRDTSLGNFGMHLPNLSQLKLSNSIISQARDLGTSLNNLRVLWMAQCGLEDIDGLSSLQSLQELYLAYNEIQDISPCSMLENLQILDLEGNAITEISQVEFLQLCSKLNNLTLEGNPICTTPSVDATSTNYNYRKAVHKAVPHLLLLDDEPLAPDEEEESSANAGFAFDDDWDLINEFYADGTIMDRDETLEDELLPAVRPGTASIRPATGYRPGSALKPYTAALKSRSGNRPGSSSRTRPMSAARPGTSYRPPSAGSSGSSSRPGTGGAFGSTDDLEQQDDASELTLGSVVCGNISKALRARTSQGKMAANKHALKMMAKSKHQPEHTYDQEEDDETMKELLQELKDWKSDYHIKRDKIDAEKAPQVLTIEHDDAISLSADDDDSVASEEEEEVELMVRPRRTDEPTPPPDSGISSDQSIDFMHTKPKKRLSDGSSQRRRLRLQHDESYEAPKSPTSPYSPQNPLSLSKRSSLTPPSPPSSRRLVGSERAKAESLNSLRGPSPVGRMRPGSDVEGRPYSGPENLGPTRNRFRLNPVVDKSKPKVIDSKNPIIRTSVNSPEKLVPEGPRAVTSKAALGHPMGPSMHKIRKGQLANVALLPSKPPKFSNGPDGGKL